MCISSTCEIPTQLLEFFKDQKKNVSESEWVYNTAAFYFPHSWLMCRTKWEKENRSFERVFVVIFVKIQWCWAFGEIQLILIFRQCSSSSGSFSSFSSFSAGNYHPSVVGVSISQTKKNILRTLRAPARNSTKVVTRPRSSHWPSEKSSIIDSWESKKERKDEKSSHTSSIL